MIETAVAARRGRLTLTQRILIGLVGGILVGAWVSWAYPAGEAATAGARETWLKVLGTGAQIFLRAIKMIIGPLLFATLVVGVAGGGHARAVGRMALRAIIYFEVATTFALFLGLAAVNLIRPGVGVNLPATAEQIATKPQTWDQILVHLVPESALRALAENDVLQIVVFSLVFALALGMVGEKGRPMIQWCETLAEIMFKFTNIVMKLAPFGVGAAIAATIARSGLGVLGNLIWLIGTLYVTTALFIVGVLLPVAWFFKVPLRKFLKVVKEPALIAFSTTSSEAALPRALEAMERLGCPRRIVSFVLPLGYAFNLDGTTVFLSLASIFIAQAGGLHLGVGQQLGMMLTLMLTSKGIAGVPRGGTVILAATAAQFNLPLEGVMLVFGVDALMDMVRTMTNVVGNCLATVVISKWEGDFSEASDEELDRALERGEI
jgi:proton glutamate symport protein